VNAELPTPPQKPIIEESPIPLPIDKSIRPKNHNLEIPDDIQVQIEQLAPLARTYRSRMSSTSAAAVANSRLRDICRRLHEGGVSVKDLADSAGVTYRAMYKRLFL
jgi:methylphosphotriester-DNA--protein-cysteine methyltransferase